MKETKLALVNEDTSPLFRIMSVYNWNLPNKGFANNISAFHVGNGVIVSVAHNLRLVDNLPFSITDSYFQAELLPKIGAANQANFNAVYPRDPMTNLRPLTLQGNRDQYVQILNASNVDRRFSTLYTHDCCRPFLVATFRNNSFCNDVTLNQHFPAHLSFPEPVANRHTFLVELQLLDTFINEDVAIYKITNTPNEIINKLPSLAIDYQVHDTATQNYYCLQSAPFNEIGRIINEARIEGFLDTFVAERDSLGNTYIMDGLRYLIKGYFRFGSSGAPYLAYDTENNVFKANAIQSQASGIQFSINGNMQGNQQYVNGIASPLSLVQNRLNQRIQEG